MASPAFPCLYFSFSVSEYQRFVCRVASGCSKPGVCQWRVAVTPIFWVIFLAFPVFLARLAGEERSAVAGSCWEDENKGNFYW